MRLFLRLTVIGILTVGVFTGIHATTLAQTEKPFILPVAAAPGPSTWLLGQPYGNTIGAFIRGSDWYEAGQRLHFGIDFSMPCGTELVAVADGVVAFVDDLGFGSGPHNLLLRHDQHGAISLYGHLLERPNLVPGQPVTQGQVVALSGDPDVTCDSRPHLHFEVRSLGYRDAYNPVNYIDADWHALAAIGSFQSPQFQQDLDNARQWLSIDDQPPVAFGGRALNVYQAPYPDTRNDLSAPNPPIAAETVPLSDTWTARPLAYDGCCANAWWNPTDPTRLYTIDGSANQRAAIYEWNAASGEPVSVTGQAPPPLTSPDGTHIITRENDSVVIRRTGDGAAWTVNTENELPSISTDNSRILWQITRDAVNVAQSEPQNELWIADINGGNANLIVAQPNTSARWLDDSRVLISVRNRQNTLLAVFDAGDGSSYVLGSWDRLRGLSIAPGGDSILFYLTYNDDPALDGIYHLPVEQGAAAQKLDWFGSWCWRDANSVYYLPFNGGQAPHTLWYYDLTTGENRQLVEEPFLVANGDWSVSPDGQRIAFWNANDLTLWLLENNG